MRRSTKPTRLRIDTRVLDHARELTATPSFEDTATALRTFLRLGSKLARQNPSVLLEPTA